VGRIAANFFISLDGVVEAPDQWHFDYFDDRMGAIIGEGASQYDAFLMGRTLYDEWSSYWPQQGDDVPFAPFINSVRKYVLSSSVQEPSWNNTVVLRDADDVRRAKQETERGIGMSGSTSTVRWLLDQGLLDELNLLVHPVVVGGGRERLFEADSSRHPLRLTHHEVLGTGVVHLRYEPVAT
jgi:dihydrofolate reductase